MKNYKPVLGKTRTGLATPVKDLKRSHTLMKEMKLKEEKMAEKATQVKEDAVFSILLKLFFIFLMLLGFAFEYAAINNAEGDILNIYYSVMTACLFFFVLTFFSKIRVIAYCAFVICIVVYGYLHDNLNEIVTERRRVDCLETGKIYDPVQKICRSDCWNWDEELGCLKEQALPDER